MKRAVDAWHSTSTGCRLVAPPTPPHDSDANEWPAVHGFEFQGAQGSGTTESVTPRFDSTQEVERKTP